MILGVGRWALDTSAPNNSTKTDPMGCKFSLVVRCVLIHQACDSEPNRWRSNLKHFLINVSTGAPFRGRWALEPPFPLLSLSSFFLPSLSFLPSSFPFPFPSPSPPSLLFCAEIFFWKALGLYQRALETWDQESPEGVGRWALEQGHPPLRCLEAQDAS